MLHNSAHVLHPLIPDHLYRLLMTSDLRPVKTVSHITYILCWRGRKTLLNPILNQSDLAPLTNFCLTKLHILAIGNLSYGCSKRHLIVYASELLSFFLLLLCCLLFVFVTLSCVCHSLRNEMMMMMVQMCYLKDD